jgi:hypothetical protein
MGFSVNAAGSTRYPHEKEKMKRKLDEEFQDGC